MDQKFNLRVLPIQFAICKLEPDQPVPEWATKGDFWSVTKTESEISILCRKSDLPDHINSKFTWRALKIDGQFSFEVVGVLAAVSKCLADAGISILTVSLFDTDVIFVQDEKLDKACTVLKNAGHSICKS